eukprot:1160228-Pelagomonas_calceolata.AAC.2
MQCLRQGVLCTPAASSSRASLPVSPLFLGRGSSRISGLSVNEGLQLHRVQWKFPSRTPHTAAEARGSNDSFAEGGPTSAAGTGDRGVMGAAARAGAWEACRRGLILILFEMLLRIECTICLDMYFSLCE